MLFGVCFLKNKHHDKQTLSHISCVSANSIKLRRPCFKRYLGLTRQLSLFISFLTHLTLHFLTFQLVKFWSLRLVMVYCFATLGPDVSVQKYNFFTQLKYMPLKLCFDSRFVVLASNLCHWIYRQAPYLQWMT